MTVKLTQKQLHSLIKEAIQSREPGSPLWEVREDDGAFMQSSDYTLDLLDDMTNFIKRLGSGNRDEAKAKMLKAMKDSLNESIEELLSHLGQASDTPESDDFRFTDYDERQPGEQISRRRR